MEELNHTQSVSVIHEDDYDTLTSVDLGDAYSISQVDEAGDFHNVVIGVEQAEALIKLLQNFVA